MTSPLLAIVAIGLGTLCCAAGLAAAGPDWDAIVPGSTVSQPYGCSALALEPADPGCPAGRRHTGIDLAARTGTPVHAAAAGVASSGEAGPCGLHVVIQHGPNAATVYCHLLSVAIASGQSVRGGQFIGRVGASGAATGPHLHFELHINGRAVDPSSWPALPAAVHPLPKESSWSTRSSSSVG